LDIPVAPYATQDPRLHAGEVPDFLNFARKAVVSETTHLKEAWQRGVVVKAG